MKAEIIYYLYVGGTISVTSLDAAVSIAKQFREKFNIDCRVIPTFSKHTPEGYTTIKF